MSSNFTRRQILVTGAGAAAMSYVAAPAIAQSWRPSKPVRVVISDGAGGGTDQASRIFAEYMSRKLGQPFVADNRPGANGVVAATDVKNATPDGYTLLYTVSSALMTQKVLYKRLPYDPVKDFQPVGGCPVSGVLLVVNPATGATTLQQFVDFARKNPVNIGTYGAGSLAHIGVAAMEKFYGISFSPVHYRGGTPMWADLASGTLHAAFGSRTGGRNVVAMGRGNAVAIQGRSRVMDMPDVPTFLEQGVTERGLSLMGYTCMMAPAAVPESVVDQYSDLIVEAGRDEPTWQKLMALGTEERPIGRAQLKKWIVEEGPIWAELTEGLGLTPG
jgi:tripartite-type tricarboxylate transporter receptor subunit TctC